VFFANSGTEANEAALKFARKWAKYVGPPTIHAQARHLIPYNICRSVDSSGKKTEYVAFTNGFSGRSMGALSCTHKAKYREYYNPLIPGVTFSPFNDLDAASKVLFFV
jgi:acetylornithine aminotransferase